MRALRARLILSRHGARVAAKTANCYLQILPSFWNIPEMMTCQRENSYQIKQKDKSYAELNKNCIRSINYNNKLASFDKNTPPGKEADHKWRKI